MSVADGSRPAASPKERSVRNLVLVLGDQLDRRSAAFDGFDRKADAVWMAEVAGESTHVWSHKARIAVFLSAMRHFRAELRAEGICARYSALDDPENRESFAGELERAVRELKPQRLMVVQPGEWRVEEELRGAARSLGVPLDVLPDRHFLCSPEDFAAFAEGRRELRLEHFYRMMRRRTGWLMDDGQPAGGRWNYDADNRQSFGQAGPGEVPPPRAFPPDDTTRAVLALVEARFPEHPGSLGRFDWPVTRAQAELALADFVENRLTGFGPHEDAMWTGEPYLYHSRLSSALNLKLLDPRVAIAAATRAYETDRAPLQSAEGFVRQLLGWREYIRGMYWHYMPGYAEMNHFGAHRPLPAFYWTAATDMACLREVIGQTLECSFAHHIQRLMVTGLFALLLGVEPRQVHEWYLAIYVDAVEWVEMPNVLGMSQYADGGLLASKPYLASGKYIARMSNYCRGCRYRPDEATTEAACPFTTLYWDFLLTHGAALGRNPRMALQVRNLSRLAQGDRDEIRRLGAALRESFGP